MWLQKRVWKIRWTDRVRNEEVLLIFKKKINILHAIKGRKERRKEKSFTGLVTSCLGTAFYNTLLKEM
jgi:hypothetical protein